MTKLLLLFLVVFSNIGICQHAEEPSQVQNIRPTVSKNIIEERFYIAVDHALLTNFHNVVVESKKLVELYPNEKTRELANKKMRAATVELLNDAIPKLRDSEIVKKHNIKVITSNLDVTLKGDTQLWIGFRKEGEKKPYMVLVFSIEEMEGGKVKKFRAVVAINLNTSPKNEQKLTLN